MVQMIFVLALLMRMVGWVAASAGVLLLLCLLPVAARINVYLARVQVTMLDCTDARVKLISEASTPSIVLAGDLRNEGDACQL